MPGSPFVVGIPMCIDSDEDVGVGDGLIRSILGDMVAGQFPVQPCPWRLGTGAWWLLRKSSDGGRPAAGPGSRLIDAILSESIEEPADDEKLQLRVAGLTWPNSKGSAKTDMLGYTPGDESIPL